MKPVSDWRRALVLSISFWMQFFGLVALIAPEARFRMTGQDSDPVFLWWLGVLLLIAGLAGRLYRQGLSWWREWLRIAAIIAMVGAVAWLMSSEARAEPVGADETLAIAVPFIAEKEGIRLSAYIPVKGDVPTICVGLTTINGRKVEMGMTMTLEACLKEFRRQVAVYLGNIRAYYTRVTLNERLTAKRDTAYTSLAFNCGVAAIGRSTAVKRLNNGDIAGGCEAIGWWDKMGRRVLRGLTLRRAEERALCMAGL